MVIDRRSVLGGITAAIAAGTSPQNLAWAADASRRKGSFLTTARLSDGSFAAFALSMDGRESWRARLPGRGHDCATHPNLPIAVFFERRPGSYAVVLDTKNGRVVKRFACPIDRRFCGHGFFSVDGSRLFAVENDFDAERGVLGVYDCDRDFKRAGEFETGGIGPHEAILLRGGKMAAVANGGIATHPDFPREKLNLASMRSNISVIDLSGGRLLQTNETPDLYQKLSIRHLAEAENGVIWFGSQYEGDPTRNVPLAGRLTQSSGLQLFQQYEQRFRSFRNYVGSVSTSADGSRIAMTSPRGGVALIWDTGTCDILEEVRADDLCGILPGTKPEFRFTNGQGHIIGKSGRVASSHPVSWDNHARVF